ncbi:hypothetical protein [Tateyamaria omphalii]|nr:hypothetical protein [Tateyamaria omphalii]
MRPYIVQLRPTIRAGWMAVRRILAVGADRLDFGISTRWDGL